MTPMVSLPRAESNGSGNGRLAALAAPGVALCVVDSRRRVHLWNQAAEELSGVRSDEVVGAACTKALGTRKLGFCRLRCPLIVGMPAEGGAPVDLRVSTALGECGVELRISSVAVDGERYVVHAMRDVGDVGDGIASLPGLQRGGRGVIAVLPAQKGERERVHLTRRQREVLELLAHGLSAKAIAVNLGISQHTVRNHIRAILAELGAHSQVEALAAARRLQLVA